MNEFMTKAAAFAKTVWNVICKALQTAWAAVKRVAPIVWRTVCGALKIAWEAVCKALKLAWTAVKKAAPIVWKAICSTLKFTWSFLCKTVKIVWTAVKKAAVTAWKYLMKLAARLMGLSEETDKRAVTVCLCSLLGNVILILLILIF